MAGLSRADIEHVAYLARLGLTEAEIDRLEGELNAIIDQYAALTRLDTEAIPPTAQVIEVENRLREDTPGPSMPVEAVLELAPARHDEHVVVRPILGGNAE